MCEEVKSIDMAVQNIDLQISHHKSSSKWIMINLFLFSILIFALAYFVYTFQMDRNDRYDISITELLESIEKEVISTNSLENVDFASLYKSVGEIIQADTAAFQVKPINIIYIFLALFILIFGVLMAIYRFHLSEISKAQHYKFGLLRIRIAANNHGDEGFGSEVRGALTLGAFAPPIEKGKKIENPLPGHPGSDATSLLLNKLLDNFEIKSSKK